MPLLRSLCARIRNLQKDDEERNKEEVNIHATILDPAQLTAVQSRRCALIFIQIKLQSDFTSAFVSTLLPCCISPNKSSDKLQTRKRVRCDLQAVSVWRGDSPEFVIQLV